MNEIKEAMRNAAALIGATNGIKVSRKVLPIRKHVIQGNDLTFTTRLIYDGAGRCIEEVRVLSGTMPPEAPRFYLVAQIEFSRGDAKRAVSLSNPIPAKTITEAFGRWQSVFEACCAELEAKVNEAEKAHNGSGHPNT